VSGGLRGWLGLVGLSAQLVAGRRFWVVPLLPLLWSAFQAMRLLVGWREQSFDAVSGQNTLIGVPLVVLAIGLGVRIIAAEIDRRTIEIAYTVPGGAHRVWLAKLAAAVLLLLAAEAALALVTFAFFTSFPVGALYGALQAALFYLVLAMALAALFRSEITGAMATVAVLVVSSFLGGRFRVSPFFNPLANREASSADLLAWTVQNRIGYVLAIAAVTALAFARAERREKILGG
jgi:ABC-type transport system involved in multi-copper enzyme maturation permease subunit